MTFEEFERGLWAVFKNREAELKDHMRSAWYVASLMRQQRLPPLHVWMGPPKVDANEMARLKADHERMMKEFG